MTNLKQGKKISRQAMYHCPECQEVLHILSQQQYEEYEGFFDMRRTDSGYICLSCITQYDLDGNKVYFQPSRLFIAADRDQVEIIYGAEEREPNK